MVIEGQAAIAFVLSFNRQIKGAQVELPAGLPRTGAQRRSARLSPQAGSGVGRPPPTASGPPAHRPTYMGASRGVIAPAVESRTDHGTPQTGAAALGQP